MALKYQSTFTGAQIQRILEVASQFDPDNLEAKEFTETITDDDYIYLSSGKWISAKKFLSFGGGGSGTGGDSIVHLLESSAELPNIGTPGHIYVIKDTMTMFLCTKGATYDNVGNIIEKEPELEQILTDKNIDSINGGLASDWIEEEEESMPEE